MKIMNLSMPSVLAMSLLAGCVMQPGDEPGEGGADPALQAGPEDGALDARAAVAAETKDMSALTSTTMSLATWYSNPVAPGATQHWVWNNASLTAAYQAGASPVGASTSNVCKFEITRSWDVQKYGGEREFHFMLQNTGAITCGANVLLESQQRVATWGTSGLDVGASRSWTWNNASPSTGAFFAGVSPTGATSSSNCELEVTRSWYLEQPSGEREFHFTVKNVGAIACQGDIQLGLTTSASSSWQTAALAPGASQGFTWNNANPLDRIYVPGLAPLGASGLTACQLEVTQSYYLQKLNADGTNEREFHFTVKNVGSLSCFGTVLLNYMN